MELTKRTRSELDWPEWAQWPAWSRRRMVDWADTVRDLVEQSEPKVEEYEDDGQLVVRAEMPGIDPDKDVEVAVADHTLHLRVERRSEKTTEDKKGYRSEFRYGSFSRSVRLPAGATESDVTASYVDGVLEVRIPIDDGAASMKKVPITRG